MKYQIIMVAGLQLAFNGSQAIACQIDGDPRPFQDVQLTELVNGLDRPLKMISLPKSSSDQNNSKFLIVEQTGKIKLSDLRSNSFKTSLDLSDIVTDPDTNPEGGLLGLALHPKFPSVKRIFVNYTYGSKLKSRIAEFSINDDFMINRSSEKIILEIVQPYSNHNGGDIVFGPDGYLYAGFGDGGSAGDPQSNAQNLKVLLGKMLRLDIDSAQPYAIPPTNPFVNNADAKSEIFALGLRNPWRFSFDRVTGDLWAGDVGQNRLEEINIVKSGGNYGWRTMEANLCFKPSNNCNKEGLIAPITQKDRSQGVSVTGGYVYRGRSMPSLVGTYVYGDFQSGNIWGLRYQDGKVVDETLLLQSSSKISSFAEDLSGEIYVINHEGSILKFTQNSVSNQPENRFPYKLSETKCFTSLKPLVPVESAVKYEVNSPLWSDGALKDRFAIFPKSESAQKVVAYTESPWEFPNDTSFIKNFYLPQKVGNQIESRIVETRILIRTESGIKGFSYKWNQDQTEAFYQAGASKENLVLHENGTDHNFSYYFPSSNDCHRCHTDSKSVILGFTTSQLNKDVVHDGHSVNQLELFSKSVWLDASDFGGTYTNLPKYVDYRDQNASLEQRARGFMDVQCATCHNLQTNTGNAKLNLNYSTSLAQTGLCNKAPNAGDAGLPNRKLLEPGHPETSILMARLNSSDPTLRMPAVATSRIDADASRMMSNWIKSLQDCR